MLIGRLLFTAVITALLLAPMPAKAEEQENVDYVTHPIAKSYELVKLLAFSMHGNCLWWKNIFPVLHCAYIMSAREKMMMRSVATCLLAAGFLSLLAVTGCTPVEDRNASAPPSQTTEDTTSAEAILKDINFKPDPESPVVQAIKAMKLGPYRNKFACETYAKAFNKDWNAPDSEKPGYAHDLCVSCESRVKDKETLKTWKKDKKVPWGHCHNVVVHEGICYAVEPQNLARGALFSWKCPDGLPQLGKHLSQDAFDALVNYNFKRKHIKACMQKQEYDSFILITIDYFNRGYYK